MPSHVGKGKEIGGKRQIPQAKNCLLLVRCKSARRSKIDGASSPPVFFLTPEITLNALPCTYVPGTVRWITGKTGEVRNKEFQYQSYQSHPVHTAFLGTQNVIMEYAEYEACIRFHPK